MSKQPAGLALAQLERRKVAALERIAAALENLRELAVFVPYPAQKPTKKGSNDR